MTWYLIIIGILVTIIIALGYIIRNLLRKNETAEDILVSYMEYLSQMDQAIEESDKRLKEIDSTGHFEADDEIGWFFDTIKTLQDTLNSFRVSKL